MIKIIEFYSTWCGPCKMLKPILEKLKNEMKFELEEVCIDDGVQEKYNNLHITSVPTLIIYKDDILKEVISGFRGENKIKEILNKII